ncbi:DUF881 domain-containing protein [Ruania alkalisoli]|uniref:DUF881 domain-containing protein n=1 Tax=Ruania alkalisoli TaxID=2779775 RepID=A0A7M1SZJ0_9MICO|nr:DUF881 domain-containing protein [Ruania alkalisoli]QOR72427.1 DUF881 domain-containing protein [Ruania alkalisoli]
MTHHSGAHRAEDGDGPENGPEGVPPSARAPQSDGRGRSLRSQLLIGAMCVLLGFAIVAQVRQTQGDEFSALREDDLVRLLDEVTQRNEELADQSAQLTRQRDSLLSGSDGRALQEDQLDLLNILAGTVPVEGPGVVVTVEDPDDDVNAQQMVHMLEEMRNAGAEAIAVSGQRLTASSAFVDTADGGMTVNGNVIESPYEWRVIGNADTIAVALDIPGGAFAIMRTAGASVEMSERELVQITAVRDIPDPEFAEPVENGS